MSVRAVIVAIESRLGASRRAAFAALWLFVIAQIIWTIYYCVRTRPAFADIYYPVLFTPAALALALTAGRARGIAAIPRLLIGAAFIENVVDRLGFIGPPGAPGVSWGDFPHFIAYTAQVNSFAPASLIPALAVLATIAEGTFGITMLLGIRTKLASIGSALLLFTFASAMVMSGLSQLQYAVYLMSVAAWALATVDASAFSIDALVRKLRRPALSTAEASEAR